MLPWYRMEILGTQVEVPRSEARRVQGIRKDSFQGNLDLPAAATKPRGFGDGAGDLAAKDKPCRAELPSRLRLPVVALYPQP